MVVDIVTIKAEGSHIEPVAYLTNMLNKPVAGAISLVVDGKIVHVSKPYVFEPGQTSVKLEWNIPKIGDVHQYDIHAMGEFCGTVWNTDDVTFNTYPSTVITPISESINVELLTDEEGNVIARAGSLYSSNINPDMDFKVISPDGTCVIGGSDECLVRESTFGMRGNIQSVTIDEQIYRIRYSGPDNALERFTITSIDPIVGYWSIYKVSSEGILPEAHAEDGSVKIKYRAQKINVDTGASEEIIPSKEIVEFGGIIPSEKSPISIFDVNVVITDEASDELSNVIVQLSPTKTVSATETHNKTLSNQPLVVSALVEKPIEFERAELRIITTGESLDDYHAIKMDASDLDGNPAYSVLSVNVPWELISVGPEVTYWIHLMGDETEESEKFTINVIEESQKETIEFGGIIEDTISKLSHTIKLEEHFSLGIDNDNLREAQQTIYVPDTIENNQNLIWILMIISLMGLVIGLRKFSQTHPVIIRRDPHSVLIERTIQGTRQFISIRNYSALPFRNCLVLSNNLACNWTDSKSSYPRDIEPGESVIVEIKGDIVSAIISIKSDNTVKCRIPLNSMNGPSCLKFD